MAPPSNSFQLLQRHSPHLGGGEKGKRGGGKRGKEEGATPRTQTLFKGGWRSWEGRHRMPVSSEKRDKLRERDVYLPLRRPITFY